MTWLVVSGLAWTLLALAIAVVLGRGISLADKRDPAAVPTVEVNRSPRPRGDVPGDDYTSSSATGR
jgi:hypothetical protein